MDANARVSIAVGCSASNDGSHMLAEARLALLLQRVLGNPEGSTPEEALWLATVGRASVVGQDDIGQIAMGKAADFIAFGLNRLAYAGTIHHLLAALLLREPQNVFYQ